MPEYNNTIFRSVKMVYGGVDIESEYSHSLLFYFLVHVLYINDVLIGKGGGMIHGLVSTAVINQMN